MKSPLKFVFSLLSLGLAAAAPALVADDTTTAPPPASAPPDQAAPPESAAPDQPPPPEARHGGRRDQLKMIADKLGMSADQRQKAGAIMKSTRAQMKALHEDTTLSDDDKRAKFRELMKAQHEQIRALLTPDQQKQFDAMRPTGGRRADSN